MKSVGDIGFDEDKVWGSAEATVNLGNYENVKVMTGWSCTLDPGANQASIRNEMMKEMIQDVLRQGKRVKIQRRKEREEL